MDFVDAGAPLVAGRVPIRVAVPAGSPFPEGALVIHQFILPIPECTPLDAIRHIVVTKSTIEMTHRVFEFHSGVNGLQVVIQAAGELERAEKFIIAGRDLRFEFLLNF